MKRKFFLHRQNAPMSAQTVVYRVWIGESVKEQRILARLMAWAFAHGATLRSWTEDIDFFLIHESDRIFRECDMLNFGFVSTDLTARDCLILAEGNLWESFENNLTTPKAFFFQLSTLFPASLLPQSNPSTNSFVLAEPRNHLSAAGDTKPQLICFK